MNSVYDLMYYPKLDESVKSGLNNAKDPNQASKQIEQVFLNELLKNMLENTEFGKEKIVSSYMPYITTEVAKSLSDRGIGIHEFLMKSPSFRNMVTKSGSAEALDSGEVNKTISLNKQGNSAASLKVPVRGGISSVYKPAVRQR